MSLREIAGNDHTLVLTWQVACELHETWVAITEPGSVAQWLGTVIEGDLGTADNVVIDHGDGYLCSSALRHRDRPRAIEFTWGFPDEPTSMVKITLEDAGDETTLRLVHEGLGPLLPSYRVGWCVHLTYLEAAAVGSRCLPRCSGTSTRRSQSSSPAMPWPFAWRTRRPRRSASRRIRPLIIAWNGAPHGRLNTRPLPKRAPCPAGGGMGQV